MALAIAILTAFVLMLVGAVVSSAESPAERVLPGQSAATMTINEYIGKRQP
jgi:hypothetical protein